MMIIQSFECLPPWTAFCPPLSWPFLSRSTGSLCPTRNGKLCVSILDLVKVLRVHNCPKSWSWSQRLRCSRRWEQWWSCCCCSRYWPSHWARCGPQAWWLRLCSVIFGVGCQDWSWLVKHDVEILQEELLEADVDDQLIQIWIQGLGMPNIFPRPIWRIFEARPASFIGARFFWHFSPASPAIVCDPPLLLFFLSILFVNSNLPFALIDFGGMWFLIKNVMKNSFATNFMGHAKN